MHASEDRGLGLALECGKQHFDCPIRRQPARLTRGDAAISGIGILKRDPDAWIVDVDGADATCRPSPIVEV